MAPYLHWFHEMNVNICRVHMLLKHTHTWQHFIRFKWPNTQKLFGKPQSMFRETWHPLLLIHMFQNAHKNMVNDSAHLRAVPNHTITVSQKCIFDISVCGRSVDSEFTSSKPSEDTLNVWEEIIIITFTGRYNRLISRCEAKCTFSVNIHYSIWQKLKQTPSVYTTLNLHFMNAKPQPLVRYTLTNTSFNHVCYGSNALCWHRRQLNYISNSKKTKIQQTNETIHGLFGKSILFIGSSGIT